MTGALRLLAILLTITGCRSLPSQVSLRPDGSPGPEECPPEALKTMRQFEIRHGMAAEMYLHAREITLRQIFLDEGPIESVLVRPLGNLDGGTMLLGRVWTSGPNVVIRYYGARPPGWEIVPICAEARATVTTPLTKPAPTEPGKPVLSDSTAVAVAVEAFR